MKVLAFDIGIRNLAWCLLEKTDTAWKIHGWENYDLVAGTTTQEAKTAAKTACATCGKKAAYQHGESAACAKHCPATHPPLRDLSGTLLKTLPKVDGLKAILGATAPKKGGKAALTAALAAKFSLPLTKVKAPRGDDLTAIHNSIQAFARSKAKLFGTATHILLENQPVFKNPTMKSVQILLFATLRDLVPGERSVTFVHAGKKVKGATKGDAGYNERKKGGEDRVKEFFEKQSVVEAARWREYYGGQQKTSDLCDALCMCLDRINTSI